MEDDYNIYQDSVNPPLPRNLCDIPEFDPLKEFPEISVFEESYGDLDDGSSYRNNRGGRGNYRGRGRGWNGPPMRFRGRGYGPSGPPRGRGYYRGRGGPRYINNNYDWGPRPQMMGNYGPPMMGPLPMGPPPNMMGQPPPYAPPNMPPPNMPAPEIWVETKSEDGNLYYYNSRTRETTWTRPVETAVCKVITQGEMEASVTGHLPANTGPQIRVNMGSMSQMGGPPPMGPFSQPPPWGLDDGLRDDLKASPRDNVSPGDSGQPAQPSIGYPANAQNTLEESLDALTGGNQPGTPECDEVTSPGDQELQLSQANSSINGGVRARAFIQCQHIIRKKTTILLLERIGGDHSPGKEALLEQLTSSPSDKQVSPGESGQPAHAPNGAVQSAQTPAEPASTEDIPIPPKLSEACGKWSTHKAPDGRSYYYNAKRKLSVWEKPLPLRQLEEFHAKVAAQKMGIPITDKIDSEVKTEVIDLDEYEEEELAAEKEKAEKQRQEEEKAEREKAEKEILEKVKEENERAEREKEESERVERERIEREKELEKLEAKLEEMDGKAEEPFDEETKVEEKQSKVEDKQPNAEEKPAKTEEKVAKEEEKGKVEGKSEKSEGKQDKEKEKAKTDRGITSTPIFGTPWCVVWTYEGHVFFYNPTAPASVWERPAELAGRADVDRAVSQPPPAYIQRKKAEAAAELKRAAEADPEKKSDDGGPSSNPANLFVGSKKALPLQINMGRDAAIGAEMRAAVERAKVPFSARLDTFVQMLRDRQVSAFSTWEKELQKIVFDSRYLLLNYKERKEVFDKFVRERAEEERKEKKSRLQQKRAAFRTLLEEARLHSKSLYAEFAIKFAKDERFKGVEKPRDRETFFAEYVLALRQKEKEEKDRRREQAKVGFMAMLKESNVDRHARWADVKKRLDADARYKAVDSSSLKEHYFQDYCRLLKEERRRDKDKERDSSSGKKETKDPTKDKEKKGSDKSETTTEEREPTPPPEEWADILGIPEEKRRLAEKRLAEKKLAESKAKKADLKSPLQSPKEKSPAKVERKSPLKSPKAKPKTEKVDKVEKIKSPVTSPQGKREMKAEVRIVPLEMEMSDSDDEKLSQSVEQKKKKKVDSPEVEKKRLRSSKCLAQVPVAEKRKKVTEEQKKGKEKKRRRKNEKE